MWRILSFLSLTGMVFGADEVVESAREFPLAKSVDVLVVGGSSGGVAAAVAARQAGASVFLAGTRPYLGEDIAGTLRLWLTPDEKPDTPLGEALFLDRETTIPFVYTTSHRGQGKHLDPRNEVLIDGLDQDAQRQSVEYPAQKVKVNARFATAQPLSEVEVVSFKRTNDFDLSRAHISISSDGKQWSAPIPLTPKSGGSDERRVWVASVNQKAKFVGFAFFPGKGCKRMLLGEIRCRKIVPEGTVQIPRPLWVKQVMDQTLLSNKVEFLTGCYITDLLRDESGKIAGAIFANRSGRQAIRAKCIIDATDRATVARLAGASFVPFSAGTIPFERIILADKPPQAPGMTVRALPGTFSTTVQPVNRRKGNPAQIDAKAWLCTLAIPMKDNSFAAFAEAEQIARDQTFVPTQVEVADQLFQVPPDPMNAPATTGPHAAFRPKGIDHLILLNGCAALSRAQASTLLRPLSLIRKGMEIGAWAAQDAKSRPSFTHVTRRGDPMLVSGKSTVCEMLQGLRPFDQGLPSISAEPIALPVLGRYDVVIVGGGTGGAPAGIGAGRGGAKALLIEYLYGLGGVGTLGMIGKYWYGNVCGFTKEHDLGVKDLGAAVHVIGKREWWRRENRRCGTEIWFGTMGCGTVVKENRVVGVVVATPFGRGVVLAKNVVDATGNADLAAASGAPCLFQNASEIAVQGAGLSPIRLGASYINSDWGYVNDGDAVDQWLFGVRGRAGAGRAWDISQVTESRERRRVVGAVCVMPLDVVNGRTFPDTIVQGRSDFDSHGYSVDDICYVSEPNGKRIYGINVPYRAILPKSLDGLAVIGIGASAHRDAMPLMRMQPDVQNMGYAAGMAGAMAAKADQNLREIDVRKLQKHLVSIGNIPQEVLSWKDNADLSSEQLTLAVKRMGNGYRDVAKVLTKPREALPLLRDAYKQAETPSARLIYAHVLGILGDATGVETLAGQISGKDPAIQINLKGLAAFGRRMSERDSFIVALGRTRDKRALPALIGEVRKCDAHTSFTRLRAITLALEALAEPEAAPAIIALLKKPGITGYSRAGQAAITPQGGFCSNNEQSLCLRELGLARALYRCGDPTGLAKEILTAYANDLRGIYALHARAVLKTSAGRPQSTHERSGEVGSIQP